MRAPIVLPAGTLLSLAKAHNGNSKATGWGIKADDMRELLSIVTAQWRQTRYLSYGSNRIHL
jgi:hypothetical protein